VAVSKKRNPQDSTRRNVQASAKRDKAMYLRVDRMGQRIGALEILVNMLIDEVQRLNNPALSKIDLAQQPFATSQRQMGYKHSTSAPHQIRVK
jgi:hypothetical protein